MRQIRLFIFIIFILLYLDIFPPPANAQGPQEGMVIETNEKGLSLTWTPPAYSLTEIEVGDQAFVEIRMPGTTPSARQGSPQLPIYSRLVGLPASGGASLRVVELERETVQLPHPPLPALTPTRPSPPSTGSEGASGRGPAAGGNKGVIASSGHHQPDPAIYTNTNFYPEDVAELGPAQLLRQHRLARLTLNPLRVNPVTRQMEVIRYLRLEITFDQAATGRATPAKEGIGSNTSALADPFALALAATLVNPEASGWPVLSSPAPSPGAQAIQSLSGVQPLKIKVNKAGLYRLTYGELQQAGWPVGTLDPRRLQLSHGWPRQEVALWVEGENDGVFNPGDQLLFYAEPEFSRFTDFDIYFLTYGSAPGLRMGTGSAASGGLPAGIAWRTAVAETNQFYDPFYQGRDGDYWYWDELRRPGKSSATYAIELKAPLTGGPQAQLTLWLQGFTNPQANPDHRVAVSVNGVKVGERLWDGAQAIKADFMVPAAHLKNGPNQVTLTLPGLSGVAVEGFWLDAMSLTYPIKGGDLAQLLFQGKTGSEAYILSGWPAADLKVYEVTDPAQPRRLSGYQVTPSGSSYTLTLGNTGAGPARYLIVPENQIASPLSLEGARLVNPPPAGADYIIITHPAFKGAIAPLATHRAAQGLRVATIDVQAIYDSYGSGRMDPAALKTFLQQAYTTWTPPAPSYVLLVGDGSYDFKNYSGYNPKNFIPPYMAHVDPWWGETASDHQFVTLAGNDPLPEMLIGRLAVNTPAEVQTVIDKIIQYETRPAPGGWNARHLVVADNPDSAGNFYNEADEGYGQVTAPFTGQRFYYSSNPSSQAHFYTDPTKLRASFLGEFKAGAGLITFYGHSSWLQWAVEGLFRYYWNSDPTYNDVVTLNNGYRLPVVLEMTCFTASFHRPEYATLDESLLNRPGGGAIAVWGSTGLGVSTGHTSLQKGFYQAIYGPQQKKLGAAVLAGKLELYSTGFHQDLLDTFTLLGDPALAMNLEVVPFSHQLHLPLIQH